MSRTADRKPGEGLKVTTSQISSHPLPDRWVVVGEARGGDRIEFPTQPQAQQTEDAANAMRTVLANKGGRVRVVRQAWNVKQGRYVEVPT